jgi:hypothetical protein
MCPSASTHPSTAFALFTSGRMLSTKLIKLFTGSTFASSISCLLGLLEAMYEIHGLLLPDFLFNLVNGWVTYIVEPCLLVLFIEAGHDY